MAGHRRDAELRSVYKRVKHTMKYDPDLSNADLIRRFNISSVKIVALRKEVEAEIK